MKFDEETLLEIQDYVNALDESVGLELDTLKDVESAIREQRKKINICPEHKSKNKELGYVALQEWASDMIDAGHDQEQCPKCGKWLFKCEV